MQPQDLYYLLYFFKEASRKTTRSSLINYFSNWINAYLDSNHFICGIFFFLNNIVHILFYYFFYCQCSDSFSVPRDRRKEEDTYLWHSQTFHIVPSIHKTFPVASAGAKRKTVPSSEIFEDSSNTFADRSIMSSKRNQKKKLIFFDKL